MAEGEFSVVQFFPDLQEENDNYEYVLKYVDPQTAVLKARDLIGRPAVKIGIIRRVIITDALDCIAFEWINGEGIVFPPQPEKQEKPDV
jgi:hypothetical protein